MKGDMVTDKNITVIYKPKELEGDFYITKIDWDGEPDGYGIWFLGNRLWVDNKFAVGMAKAILKAESDA